MLPILFIETTNLNIFVIKQCINIYCQSFEIGKIVITSLAAESIINSKTRRIERNMN